MRSLASFACVFGVLVSLLVSSSPASAQCPSWESGFGANGLNGPVYAMTVFDDGTGPALYAGGSFALAGGVAASSIAKWNGSTWSALGSGIAGNVKALAAYDDGTGLALYAGGFFTVAGGVSASSIAKWDGSAWSPLGSGINGAGEVLALASYDDGTGPALWAGGSFCDMGSVGAGILAKWNGAAWSDTGLGCGGTLVSWVSALGVLDDGTGPALLAGGGRLFGLGSLGFVDRWDPGLGWSNVVGPFGPWGPADPRIAVVDDGTGPALYSTAGGAIHKSNGLTWAQLGNGADGPIDILAGFDDGGGPALIAAGQFTTADVGVTANSIAKWNGSMWSALGNGLGGSSASVYSMTGYFDGSGMALYAGGDFTTAGGVGSNDIAAWSGCSGSGAGTSFCFGDGTGIACPCANSGAVGHGCENSVATGGALLAGVGGASLALDTLLLSSSGELPGAPSIFLQGTTELANAVPFGDGLRCIGGALKRMYVKSAVGGIVAAPAVGDPSVSARSAAVGDAIQAGQARRYQVYYRDPNASFCASPPGGGFNVSQALRILWAP